MIVIGNLQYGWTLFVAPIDHKYHWGRTAIQVSFTLFVFFETWMVPIEAYIADRVGTRRVLLVCGLLVGTAWCVNSIANSLPLLYLGAILGGIGAGGGYAIAMGNALKWFTHRRGLAAGLMAAGFGMGSALTVAPVAAVIETKGYEAAFLLFGIGQGLLVLLIAPFLREPSRESATSRQTAEGRTGSQDYKPLQVLKMPSFWLLYVMMTMMAMGGLMATAQLGPVAQDFGVANRMITIAWVSMAALPFALSLDRILNGVSRAFWGWVSDRIGRATTMGIVFSLEAVAITLLILTAGNPVLFVLFSGLTFFGWGEIYALFPAASTDLFGTRDAATNYGLLYTAKGAASLFVPFGNVLQEATGSWLSVFAFAICCDLLAATLALLVLRPLLLRRSEQDSAAIDNREPPIIPREELKPS
jgi:MFS transporter, OFA family, oxalate/formate antiporter